MQPLSHTQPLQSCAASRKENHQHRQTPARPVCRGFSARTGSLLLIPTKSASPVQTALLPSLYCYHHHPLPHDHHPCADNPRLTCVPRFPCQNWQSADPPAMVPIPSTDCSRTIPVLPPPPPPWPHNHNNPRLTCVPRFLCQNQQSADPPAMVPIPSTDCSRTIPVLPPPPPPWPHNHNYPGPTTPA